MNPREAIRLLVFVVLIPWAEGCSSTGSDYVGEWVCQEAPSSTLQIKSDGTYRLDQPDGIPTLIEGEWKVDKDPFPHVVLYHGKTMTPEIIGEMRGGDLVDRLRGLTWVRKGKAARAAPASRPGNSRTPAAPAARSEKGGDRGAPPSQTIPAPARPLPNGVTFDGNLSVSVAMVDRGPELTVVWLAFRRVGEGAAKLSRGFQLVLSDDRGNSYAGALFVLGPLAGQSALEGAPQDSESLPIGFTWVSPVKVRLARIAPIARMEIVRELRAGIFRSLDPRTVRRSLNFEAPQFPELDFDVPVEHTLSPGQVLTLGRDLSARIGDVSVKGEFSQRHPEYGRQCGYAITLPVTVKNLDYNEHSFTSFGIAVQLDSGMVTELPPGHDHALPVPAQQEIRAESSALIALATTLRRGSALPQPLRLLVYQGARFRGCIPLVTNIRARCREIAHTYSLLEHAKQALGKWSQTALVQPQPGRIEFQDYAVVGDHVWATGYRHGYGGYGYLVHSPDGGRTWATLWQGGAEGPDALQVHFFDQTEGTLVTSAGILKTNDAGKSWAVLLDVRKLPDLGVHVVEYAQVEDRRGITVRPLGSVYGERIETTDGGATWNYVDGSRKVRFRTYDAGRTWQRAASGGSA